jgi:hypothetical protein
MKRQLSEAAQVAKLIRAELKKMGVKGSVRSKNYSGGDSVSLDVTDQPPWVIEEIEAFTDKFQYGHFDGMQDLYEYSNRRDDIPQTKFLFVTNNYTKETCQLAWEKFRAMMSYYNDYPESYEDAKIHDYSQPGYNQLGERMYRYLNGADLFSGEEYCYFQKSDKHNESRAVETTKKMVDELKQVA